MRVILFILKLIGKILLIPVWLLLAFIGVCVSAVVNLYCVAKGLVGLLLGAMLVCTFIWYRTRFMNYILLGVAEFMLAGVLAAGAFILALVTEATLFLQMSYVSTMGGGAIVLQSIDEGRRVSRTGEGD